MRRGSAIQDEGSDGLPGEDSFLDIVANIVGILIILVMVVGVRASHGAYSRETADSNEASREDVSAPAANDGADRQTLLAERRQALAAQRALEATLRQAESFHIEREIAAAERDRLLAIQAIQQQDIDERRAQLSDTERSQFDVQRRIVEATIQHQTLTSEQIALVSREVEVDEVECLPTPMAKEVGKNAIHVRLRHGLLAVVPVDALREEFERDRLGYMKNGVIARDEASDTVGPINGFRMRIAIERYRETPVGASPMAAAYATRTKVEETWTFLPTAARLGLPLEQAFLPSAPLMQQIRSRHGPDLAVVAWVYPDSFDELRELKRMLWENGVAIAPWPLTDDAKIQFGSRGSKAAAQ